MASNGTRFRSRFDLILVDDSTSDSALFGDIAGLELAAEVAQPASSWRTA
jgi:hypothetical protein